MRECVLLKAFADVDVVAKSRANSARKTVQVGSEVDGSAAASASISIVW